MKTINDRISEVVAASGKNKTEFAKSINISQPFLSQICTGAKTPSERTIADICRVYEINEEWLRNGTDPMKKEVSRFEEVSNLVSKALNGSNGFKKAVIQAICNRSDKELEVLDMLLREIYDNLPKVETAPKLSVLKIAGRDGSFTERIVTDDEAVALQAKLEQLPDASDDL